MKKRSKDLLIRLNRACSSLATYAKYLDIYTVQKIFGNSVSILYSATTDFSENEMCEEEYEDACKAINYIEKLTEYAKGDITKEELEHFLDEQ